MKNKTTEYMVSVSFEYDAKLTKEQAIRMICKDIEEINYPRVIVHLASEQWEVMECEREVRQ